jgi:transcriptional regulator with XRE-family HTH domain
MYTHPQHGARQEAQDLRRRAGQWLKRLRTERGLSQRELARRLDLEAYTFISQLEAGRGRIPPDRMERWAAALEQEPGDFVARLMQYYDPVTFEVLTRTGKLSLEEEPAREEA